MWIPARAAAWQVRPLPHLQGAYTANVTATKRLLARISTEPQFEPDPIVAVSQTSPAARPLERDDLINEDRIAHLLCGRADDDLVSGCPIIAVDPTFAAPATRASPTTVRALAVTVFGAS
jgi:hypothetical protein